MTETAATASATAVSSRIALSFSPYTPNPVCTDLTGCIPAVRLRNCHRGW
ncbi:hypothetical protein [Peribacillus sp. NPDC058075]